MEFELLDGSAADKRWSMNPLRSCCWMHHLYWLREEERDLPSLLGLRQRTLPALEKEKSVRG
jgi:hypothetical protein